MIRKVKKLIENGFVHIFVGNTLIKMISFISSIVIVRLIDKTEYAYLAYADNLYNYVISFAGLGMTSAILKFCAAAESKEKDKAFFVFALKYGTLFEALLSVVVVLYVTWATIPFPEAKTITYMLVLYPTLNNIINTILGYLRAHGENQIYSRTAVIQTVFVFVGSVLFVILKGIKGIPFARYIAIVIAIISTIKIINKYTTNVGNINLNQEETRAFIIMSLSLMVSNLFSLIMPINEMSLINEMIRDEVITSNYKIATLIPSQLSFVTHSIIVYYFTIIAKMDDKRKAWETSKKVGCVSAIIIFSIAIVGAIVSPWIIRLVYGAKYNDASTLSTVFWIVYAINAGIRMVPMNFLPAIGVAKFNAMVAAISCIAHLGVAYVSISYFGIYGAGIATGIIYLISGIGYWLYYRYVCYK